MTERIRDFARKTGARTLVRSNVQTYLSVLSAIGVVTHCALLRTKVRVPVLLRRGLVLILAGLWTLDFGLGSATAAPTNALDEASFVAITKNNIFNPRRRGRMPDAPREKQPPRAVVDWFALVGIMNYDKGLFAFFEGNKSDYAKVEKPGDKIADFKVEKIEAAMVTLSRGTNTIIMPVNMQMRREEGGDWKLAPRSESYVAGNERDRNDRSRYDRGRRNRDFNSRNGSPSPTTNETPTPGAESILSAVQQMIQNADQPPPPEVFLDQGPDNGGNGGDTNEDPVLRALRERRERESNP